MLVAWRRLQPTIGGQMDVLCGALARIDRNDIVMFLQGPTGGFAPRTDLTNIQQRVMEYNKDTTSTIPAHPLDPSRTLDIDQFSQLELTQKVEGNETTQEPIDLPEGKRNLDKPRTKPLYSCEDMLDVLVTKLRVLLSGRAGFGKSTLLLRVANASTDPNSVMAKFKLVFPLKLSQMQKTSCVLEAIRDQILPGIEKAVLKKVIDDNEADTAFLLDGLDEIPTRVLNSPAPEGGYGIKDILYNKVLRRSTVLVSTRPHMIDFATKGYPHYTRLKTLGFTLDTAKKYITSYFATKSDAKNGELLISHVTSTSLMRTLAKIPILVLFLCIIWDNLSKLPDQLMALYTQFADVLVSRRCNEGEDQVALMKSIVRGLGPVALAGLLDPKGERLVFSSEEFEEKALKDGCRLGFLQQESFTSGLKKMKVVAFVHKSMQEYFAAYYFANLHHENEEEFHERLQQINPGNVCEMEYLLRFACGISSGSPATALILDHVQKQHNREIFFHEFELQKLTYLMLLESDCGKLADKLDRPTKAECGSQEDLLAIRYYLQCLSQPLIELKNLAVGCRSHEELTSLRGIDRLLHNNTTVSIDLGVTGRLHECLKLLGEILPIDNIRSIRRFRVSVAYTVSDKPDEEMQTAVVVDERLRDQIELELQIGEKYHLGECVLGSLSRVCKQIIKKVALWCRTYDDVIRLANALTGCDRLKHVSLSYTNLNGHLAGLAPLVPPSLWLLVLASCGLNNNDIPDLISILPAGHGLRLLDVRGNAFSVVGVETLTAHLRNLPELGTFSLEYKGHDAERVKQLVKQNLPNVFLL
ncbi:uncharacterized protein LOC119725855 [Patiria miniata]|uniref:NACHT domain-containing protein n=1 Tax=Patiria miniata TaxID=46514 RepID=A0A913ZQG8_PATMI|nr:uncharacterized protein LOC119725855 [Patiria miniata]